ncbi:MAG: hypothetical protein FWF59_05495 [Turicibacter sp.]|nr:hypothetical protein [Turicibacter sp.]
MVKIFSNEDQRQLQNDVNEWTGANQSYDATSMGFTYNGNGTYSIAVFYKLKTLAPEVSADGNSIPQNPRC